MYQRAPLTLVPGQSRPVIFRISFSGSHLARFTLKICHGTEDLTCEQKWLFVNCELLRKENRNPHKITFLHPSGTVSYAILRPPSEKACHHVLKDETMPILLVLHGAGVDASDEVARSTLDPVPDLPAWVIYPSGMTAWCGDDWRESLTVRSHHDRKAEVTQMNGALQILKLQPASSPIGLH